MKERLRIRCENKKTTENHEKQTIKRLKRSDYNELERNLRLELANSSGWPWRQKRKKSKTGERLENDAATKRLMLAMETDEERKARLEKMVPTSTTPFCAVAVVLSLKPILSFKLDVLTT